MSEGIEASQSVRNALYWSAQLKQEPQKEPDCPFCGCAFAEFGITDDAVGKYPFYTCRTAFDPVRSSLNRSEACYFIALTAQLADERKRVTRLEAELQVAAATLQETLPIGQCKAIGLLEVATGVKELAALRSPAAEVERLTAVESQLKEFRQWAIDTDHDCFDTSIVLSTCEQILAGTFGRFGSAGGGQ